jgi:hypothetical protein
MSRAFRAFLVAALLALPGCMAEPVHESHADAATEAACRRRADQVYEQQNRSDIYREPAPVNTPFSGNYTPGVSDRGLSDLFAHDRIISDCIRNTGTGAERSAPERIEPTPPAPTAPRH